MPELIKDIYTIDEDKLLKKSEKNDYWKRCHKFWNKVKNKKLSEILATQRDWLERIVDEIEE